MLKSLEVLTLNDNLLTKIDAGAAFGNNEQLRTLHLQNNDFTNIRIGIEGIFLAQLESFNISNNPNNRETEGIRIYSKYVDISFTNSSHCFIPDGVIVYHANNNRITNVYGGRDVQELYLAHNRIDSLQFIINFINSEILDVSFNQLTDVNEEYFANMTNLIDLNLSNNLFTAIDLNFMESLKSLSRMDISNNSIIGHFSFSVKVNALIALNIANNQFTSIQGNLRKWAPNLTSIDINDNLFDCGDLASMLLFMYFDHITPIIRSENAANDEKNNVKGIKCLPTISLKPLKLITNAPTQSDSVNVVMKNEIIKTFDGKLLEVENRIIQLLRNVSTSKNAGN